MPSAVWFSLEYLPPNVNHQYVHLSGGRKALTKEARAARADIAKAAELAGFRLNKAAVYAVRVVFIFPRWGADLDGPIKSLIDSVFGTRWDHRVVRLEAEKRVEPGVRYTEVEITEMVAPMRAKERAVPVRVSRPRKGV